MKTSYVQILIGVLILLTAVGGCTFTAPSPAPDYTYSSEAFVDSLEGQIRFVDWSDPEPMQYAFDLPDTTVKTVGPYQHEQTEAESCSRDGKRKLIFKQQDTNQDGAIDAHDLYAVYLKREESEGMKLVALPFPVRTCTCGTDDTTVACSFDSRDVEPDRDIDPRTLVIYLVDLESGKLLRRLSNPDMSCWLPLWSSDGSMIAFLAETLEQSGGVASSEIHVVNVQTGELIYAVKDSLADEPVWSPSGIRLAYVNSTYTIDPGTGEKHWFDDVLFIDLGSEDHLIVNVTQTHRFLAPSYSSRPSPVSIYGPVWSPDGEAIASVWRVWGVDEIWVVAVDGDDWIKLYSAKDEHHRELLTWQR